MAESALSLQQLASCQPRRLCNRLAELRQNGKTAAPEWETIMEALQRRLGQMSDTSHAKTVQVRKLKEQLSNAMKRVGSIEGEYAAKASSQSKAHVKDLEAKAAVQRDASSGARSTLQAAQCRINELGEQVCLCVLLLEME